MAARRPRTRSPAKCQFYPISTYIGLIAVGLLFSGSFSMFETSLLASQRHRLQALAAKGRRGAATACRLLERDIDAVIATILLWNNFANVVIASSATVLAIRLFSDDQAVLSVTSLLTTITILICAEITPKAIGVRFPERIACFAAPIIDVLSRLIPIGRVVGAIRDLFAGKAAADGEVQRRQHILAEDLLAIIKDDTTMAEAGGEHKALLYKVIGLAELSIRDLMINRKDIDYLDLEDAMEEMVAHMTSCRHHLLPLCEDGLENVVGMVRVRDAIGAWGRGGFGKDELRALASKPIYVPETIEPVKALRQLVGRKRQTCLIVDEYGGLVGMVTAAEFFNHIFGASVAGGAAALAAGASVTVNGDELVREINLNHSLNLPAAEGQTIAGLIIDRLEAFPTKAGNEIPFDDLVLTVAELDDLRIRRVTISRP